VKRLFLRIVICLCEHAHAWVEVFQRLLLIGLQGHRHLDALDDAFALWALWFLASLAARCTPWVQRCVGTGRGLWEGNGSSPFAWCV